MSDSAGRLSIKDYSGVPFELHQSEVLTKVVILQIL